MKEKERNLLINELKQKRSLKRLQKDLLEWVNLAKCFKNVYFWIPPSGASSRRKYERENSFSSERKNYKINFIVECSCKSIYVSKDMEILGNRNLNLADARKLIEAK